MRRILSVLIVVGIAQAVQSAGVQTPAVSNAQPRAATGGGSASDSPATPHSAAKACDDGWKPDMDSPYWWRWQAYHSLDCAVAVIDERIGRSGTAKSPDDTVTVPRAELERLRALAWRARDAAARIDR